MSGAEPGPARTSSSTSYLLERIAAEARRAQDLDPLEQARALAKLIQTYAGWALREAVLDCRENGMSWSELAPEVGLSQAVLSRQARANGPVVAIAGYYGRDSRNAHGPTPLRAAAVRCHRASGALTAAEPSSDLAKDLYIAVLAMTQALGANQVTPLLRTAGEVVRRVAAADVQRQDATAAERELLDAVAELERGLRYEPTIRAAADPGTPGQERA